VLSNNKTTLGEIEPLNFYPYNDPEVIYSNKSNIIIHDKTTVDYWGFIVFYKKELFSGVEIRDCKNVKFEYSTENEGDNFDVFSIFINKKKYVFFTMEYGGSCYIVFTKRYLNTNTVVVDHVLYIKNSIEITKKDIIDNKDIFFDN